MRTFEKSRSYDQGYEAVWIKAVDWFADHNVEIEKIEKASGLLTAKYRIRADDEYLDCGKIRVTGSLGKPSFEKSGSLNVTVRELPAGRARVNVNFFGSFQLVARDAWDGKLVTSSGICTSTGALENAILSYIGSATRQTES